MKLNVLKKNQPIQKIDLGKDVLSFDYSETIFLVGRSKDCHVVLDDRQVSREHLRIIHKNGKWYVEKISFETSGLYNGESFNREELKEGDSLFIGNFTINIEEIQNHKEEVLKSKISDSPKVTGTDIGSEEKNQNILITNNDFVYDLSPQEKPQDVDIDSIKELAKEEALDEQKSESSDYDFLESNVIESDQKTNKDTSLIDENILNADLDEVKEGTSYSLENIDSIGDGDGTKVIQSFAKVELQLFGALAPYDKYLLDLEKTYIGRDSSRCQIVLNEPDVSTVHAVISKNNMTIILEDLNSSNGTILNGDRINKATLSHNDEFVIGSIAFTVKFRSDFLKEENSTLMPVEENQSIEIEEVVEIQVEDGELLDALGDLVGAASTEKSIIKRIWKDDAKRKIAIYILLGAALVWMYLPDDLIKPAVQKSKKEISKDLSKGIVSNKTGKKLSDEERQSLSARYEIAKYHYYEGRYREALEDFQKIYSIDPNFNSSLQSLIALSKEGLSKLEEQEKKRVMEQALAEKKIKIKEFLVKATEFVKDHRAELAQEVFNDIAKLDPENIEVSRLKIELDDWLREKAKKELEELTKKKSRDDKVEKLKPGKLLFIQKEWFKAAGRLDDFLKIKDMDEDLTKEATDMLKISRDEIAGAVLPLVGKAKSLMEGQDLKGAYEIYQQILKIEPSHTEALSMIGDIRDQLTIKARKIYREAIISESLSLFQDAKEKLQEVQQVSPVDSDYYKKASDKLKDYLD